MRWLALITLCAAGVEIGKLDRTPDALQTLGFDVCDGEPCFRGIKPGMNWEEAKKHFPEAVVIDGYLTLNVDLKDTQIQIIPSNSGMTVYSIALRYYADGRWLPITVGDFIVQHGPPCRVIIHPESLVLIYPGIAIWKFKDFDMSAIYDFDQIRPDSHLIVVRLLSQNPQDADINCNMNGQLVGNWFGLTSADVYLKRYGAPLELIQSFRRER